MVLILAMKPASVEHWVWILVYGGLLTLCLGLFVVRGDPALGWTLLTGGCAIAVAGVALIYIRSRMGP
jgi:hypothetical protein